MINIRQANISDVDIIVQYIKDLALYEKAADKVSVNAELIKATFFTDNAKVFALIAEQDKRPIGFAVYFFNYSTWQGLHGLYLEDLYVTPEARGHGGGMALMKKLADIALKNQCGRFEWSVLDWNDPAIRFYQSIGAKPKQDWVGYRLDGQALHKFSKED